jgi:hypothetical protein
MNEYSPVGPTRPFLNDKGVPLFYPVMCPFVLGGV